jgi:FkbM family methyltransferase
MLDRLVDSGSEFLRARIPRESRTWTVLATLSRGWNWAQSVHRRNPWLNKRWERRELEFEKLLEQLSNTTKDFFVVQIGACDGLMADPIHDWIKRYRWRGILVEPQEVEFEKLKVTYRDDLDRIALEKVAVAETDGTCTLYRMKDSAITHNYQRGLASLLPNDAALFTAEIVPCITFETLTRRHHVSRIDLLQIDVEGYDFRILKSIDLRQTRPTLIRYEHKNLRPKDKKACKEYLGSHGYRILEMKYDTGAILDA